MNYYSQVLHPTTEQPYKSDPLGTLPSKPKAGGIWKIKNKQNAGREGVWDCED